MPYRSYSVHDVNNVQGEDIVLRNGRAVASGQAEYTHRPCVGAQGTYTAHVANSGCTAAYWAYIYAASAIHGTYSVHDVINVQGVDIV